MPKGIGYQDAAKVGIFSKKPKKKKENKKTRRTRDVEEQLRKAGLSEEDIKRLRDKKRG